MTSNQEGIAEGHLSACEQENRELRAEVERLREGDHLEYSLAVTNNELRAEVERLKSAVTDLGVLHITTHTENERLRALVQEHITVHHCLVCGSEPVRPKEC